MRCRRLLFLSAIYAFVFAFPRISVHAQTPAPALLSLQASTTDVQTGQEYKVEIHVDNIKELWLADIEIKYDPALVYIMGTKAGSPVQSGTFLAPPESTTVVRNGVVSAKVTYTVSMLAPADPVSGSGLIGTFRIYPLAPGTTEIVFTKADLLKVNFATDDTGQRIGQSSVRLTVTPVLLKLNITGQKVDPPKEATATPIPSDTPTATDTPQVSPTVPTATPLVNVTAMPAATPTPLSFIPVPEASGGSPLLLIAIVVMVIALIALGLVLVIWSRSRR